MTVIADELLGVTCWLTLQYGVPVTTAGQAAEGLAQPAMGLCQALVPHPPKSPTMLAIVSFASTTACEQAAVPRGGCTMASTAMDTFQ